MFEHKNAYPVILVPGVAAYGENSKIHNVFPYFGLTSTGWQKVLNNNMDVECHTVSFELLSSVWDRACELYAQLVGGTVDYGAAHSAKYGHARFGKTYEKPMLNTPWIKINLIAHGFGAPVARLFIELLYNGSQEERDVTPANELSDLFRGGFRGKVHSLVTIAGINEGISTAEALEGRLPGAKRILAKTAVAADMLLQYKNYVDPYYQREGMPITQHGVSAYIGKENDKTKLKFNEDAINTYLRHNDNIFYDMGPWGMSQLNAKLNTFDDIYYFSYSGEVTSTIAGKVTVPNLKSGITLPLSAVISTFENYLPEAPVITKENADNDGFVNTNSTMPPLSEDAAQFRDVSRCQPGIWYQMPVEKRTHFSFMGLFVRPDKFMNEIYDIMEIICNLE